MTSRPALVAAAAMLVVGLAPASAFAQAGDAYIEGTFVDTTMGQPAPEGLVVGFNFWALDGSGAGAWGATLDANGRYRIGPIPPGTYKLQFVNADFVYEGLGCPCFGIDGQEGAFFGWWEDAADFASASPVEVMPGGTTVLDFMVRIADVATEPGRWIEGTALNAQTGLPVPEGFRFGIQLFHLDGAPAGGGGVDWLNADGRYRVGPIVPGTYKVQFVDSSWFAYEGIGCPCRGIDGTPTSFISWWPDVADFASAGEVSITLNQTTTIDFLLVQVDAMPGGYIEGRLVLEDTGEPLADWVVVEAYDSSGTFVLGMTVPSDADGRYRLGPLPAGEYKLRFVDARLTGILTEWWPDRSDFASAESIEVLPGLATEDADFSLSRGIVGSGSISGLVTDAERGMPLPQINWSLYDLDGNLVVPGDRTDSSGRFVAAGLEPGSYKLAFGDSAYFAYEPTWYGGASFESAAVLEVAEGAEVTGITVSLVLKPGATAPLLPFGGLNTTGYLIASILLISIGSALIRLAPATKRTPLASQSELLRANVP